MNEIGSFKQPFKKNLNASGIVVLLPSGSPGNGRLQRGGRKARTLGRDDVIADDVITTAGGVSHRLLRPRVYGTVTSHSQKHPHQVDPRVSFVCLFGWLVLNLQGASNCLTLGRPIREGLPLLHR